MGGPIEVTSTKGEIHIFLDDYPIGQVTTLQTVVKDEFRSRVFIIEKPPIRGQVDPPRYLVLKPNGEAHTPEKLNLLRVWCEAFLIGFELNPKHFH